VTHIRNKSTVTLELENIKLNCVDRFAAIAGPEHNVSRPCSPSPCGPLDQCDVYHGFVAMCDPCGGPDAHFRPECRPECLCNSDCPFNLACLGQRCLDPCPGSCGVGANCAVVQHNPVCSCPPGYVGNPFEHCSIPHKRKYLFENLLGCEEVRLTETTLIFILSKKYHRGFVFLRF